METRTQQPVLNLLAGPDVSSQVKRFNKKTLMAILLRLKDSKTPAPLNTHLFERQLIICD